VHLIACWQDLERRRSAAPFLEISGFATIRPFQHSGRFILSAATAGGKRMSDNRIISLFGENKKKGITMLDETVVTLDKIAEILDAAVIIYSRENAEKLYLSEGVDFPFWISLDMDRQFVVFHTYLIDDADWVGATGVNELNAKFIITQIHLDEGRVWVNYWMPYFGGLDGRQLVRMMRRFGETCGAVRSELRESQKAGGGHEAAV
jgi:hypothetical protein